MDLKDQVEYSFVAMGLPNAARRILGGRYIGAIQAGKEHHPIIYIFLRRHIVLSFICCIFLQSYACR